MSPRSGRLHRRSPSKYLKPGALARLRDSRISVRSHRIDLSSLVNLSSSIASSAQPQINAVDIFPFFCPRSYGPRFPQRKKLVAARSVSPLVPTSPSPVSDSVDVGAGDGIAAR